MVTRVAVLWHMHQPSYRDPLDGTFILPWVRLHALKDYWGMVELLAETPQVRVTFNLVPSLLDQIDAYVSGEAREAELRLGLAPADRLDESEKVYLLRAGFMAHPENLIGRFPRFAELLALRGPRNDEASLRSAAPRFWAAEMRDLQVLSKLAWFDLDWREQDAALRRLIAKGRDYTEEDKRVLADRERALLAAVVPAYRRAADEGRVELSASPYYHPILPLLCDSDVHREAHPGAYVPRRFRHPEDAADQIRRAVDRHAQVFGRPPAGMWPSEGSVSEEAVTEMARAGLRWTASDEGVLERSIQRPLHRDSRGTAHPVDLLYRPWIRRTPAGEIAMLFRDRTLSDLIGFSYSGSDPEHAAHDLLERIRRIGDTWTREGQPGDPVVPIILDGENAWEHFREGGRTFLRRFYAGLQADPRLRAVTVSEAVAAGAPLELPRVFAGSWIHADFSVWIGHADDRRAWDFLGAARDALAAAEKEGKVATPALERAREAFRAASGSDWCWWYGDDHSSENDYEFDRLFRRHLRAVYEAIGLGAPEALSETLITTRHHEVRQSRPAGEVTPVLDGEITSPDEWAAAGLHRVPLTGAMHRGAQGIRAVRFGADRRRLSLLVEPTTGSLRDLVRAAEVVVIFPGPESLRYRVRREDAQARVVREAWTEMGWVAGETRAQAAVGSVLELGIPLRELNPGPGQRLEFRVLVVQNGTELERHPETGPIELGLEEVARG
ncbi:MAG TPA: glycoside hydrolase family 57 protein [Vicinamibacteria bacterium]|nr:glycoside hydrolase family 57 protein [Vicinamibacteria bacterium]